MLHAKAVKKQQEKAIASFFSLDKAVIVVKTPSYIKLHWKNFKNEIQWWFTKISLM